MGGVQLLILREVISLNLLLSACITAAQRQSVSVLGPNQAACFCPPILYRTKMSSVGPNEAACFGPRTKACNSPPDQNRLPETVLGPFQDRTKSAVTVQGKRYSASTIKPYNGFPSFSETALYNFREVSSFA